MLKIGITGGIGSGKSIICEIFRQFNIPVFEADLEAKRLINNNLKIKEDLKRLMGYEIYNKSGELNKKRLANAIFINKNLLKQVNSIIHPRVAETFDIWANQQKNVPFVIEEAAILFESGAFSRMDKTILVYAPEHLRIARVTARDNTTIEKVKERISNQMSDDKKMQLADYIITNDDKHLVIPQVIKLYELFTT